MASDRPVGFKLLGPPKDVKIIAKGRQIRVLRSLKKRFGGTNWRKEKGIARIEDEYGWIGEAEIHWFEAHGTGRVGWKIKRRLTTR